MISGGSLLFLFIYWDADLVIFFSRTYYRFLLSAFISVHLRPIYYFKWDADWRRFSGFFQIYFFSMKKTRKEINLLQSPSG